MPLRRHVSFACSLLVAAVPKEDDVRKLYRNVPEWLNEWLEETAWDKDYWRNIGLTAEMLESDGCSGVPDWFIWSCLEHDVHYRTHI